MSSFINYGKQCIEQDDIEAVTKVLQSDFLTQGPAIKDFEQAICDYTGAKYCVAVSSATAALHIAVAALDLPVGSEGITSPNTFVASANCLVYNQLLPRFADIDSDTFNIDPTEIQKKITNKTRVLIPVHFAGRACDMPRIQAIAKDHNLAVIEDAAHAIGTNYPDGGKVGNCAYSDMTVFSFHPVKTMTTGEGGAITTNNHDLYERLVQLRSHGITKDPQQMTQNPGPWYYEMQGIGFNYRMTDMQAALGSSQLAKLERFKQRRQEIVQNYHNAFDDVPWLTTPNAEQDANTCFHLYVLRFDWLQLGKSRAQVMQELRDQGIGTQVLYIPVHTQPYYREEFGYQYGDYPESEKYYERALAIPLYPSMTEGDQGKVITAVRCLQ